MSKQCYLISWCDDNHDPIYWLNNMYLGVDMDTIVSNAMSIGQELVDEKLLHIKQINITGDTFPDTVWEQLFDYFQTIPSLDEIDVDLIVNDKWIAFYDKNIVRKGGK